MYRHVLYCRLIEAYKNASNIITDAVVIMKCVCLCSGFSFNNKCIVYNSVCVDIAMCVYKLRLARK